MTLLFEKHGFEVVASQSIKKSNTISSRNTLNKTLVSSKLTIKLIKRIMLFIMPRKIRLIFLKPFYEKKLIPLYDGREYMRLLAQKKIT